MPDPVWHRIRERLDLVRRGLGVAFGPSPRGDPGASDRPASRRPSDAAPSDPRLRGVDPTLAAYVAAHDPEWFSIDLGRPGTSSDWDAAPAWPADAASAPWPDPWDPGLHSDAPARSQDSEREHRRSRSDRARDGAEAHLTAAPAAPPSAAADPDGSDGSNLGQPDEGDGRRYRDGASTASDGRIGFGIAAPRRAADADRSAARDGSDRTDADPADGDVAPKPWPSHIPGITVHHRKWNGGSSSDRTSGDDHRNASPDDGSSGSAAAAQVTRPDPDDAGSPWTHQRPVRPSSGSFEASDGRPSSHVRTVARNGRGDVPVGRPRPAGQAVRFMPPLPPTAGSGSGTPGTSPFGALDSGPHGSEEPSAAGSGSFGAGQPGGAFGRAGRAADGAVRLTGAPWPVLPPPVAPPEAPYYGEHLGGAAGADPGAGTGGGRPDQLAAEQRVR